MMVAKPMLRMPTFALRTNPTAIAAIRRTRDISPTFILVPIPRYFANTMQTGLPVFTIFKVGIS